MSYEFVPKSEYQPVREELEEIIKKVQEYCRNKESNFTFQFKLVGSGEQHLITREKGGNKGFDFDYNIILNELPDNQYWKPEFAKTLIMNAISEAIKGTKYSEPQDSTSAITIKVVDRKNKKIVHSCDFAIIYYPNNEDYNYFKYIRNNKNQNNYTWEVRNFSINYDDKFKWLKDNVDGYWDIIKKEYLKVKNANKNIDKHSFQLYYESVCNVFNQYHED